MLIWTNKQIFLFLIVLISILQTSISSNWERIYENISQFYFYLASCFQIIIFYFAWYNVKKPKKSVYRSFNLDRKNLLPTHRVHHLPSPNQHHNITAASSGLPIFWHSTCRNNTGTTVFRNSWHSRAVRMTHLSGPLQARPHRWGVAARRAEPLAYWFSDCNIRVFSLSLWPAVSSSAARRDAVTSHTARPNLLLNGRVTITSSSDSAGTDFGAKSVMSCCY